MLKTYEFWLFYFSIERKKVKTHAHLFNQNDFISFLALK